MRKKTHMQMQKIVIRDRAIHGTVSPTLVGSRRGWQRVCIGDKEVAQGGLSSAERAELRLLTAYSSTCDHKCFLFPWQNSVSQKPCGCMSTLFQLFYLLASLDGKNLSCILAKLWRSCNMLLLGILPLPTPGRAGPARTRQ